MCERNLQLITESCHILMFIYFLWSAAFACAVKMRAHGAFSDHGRGVIVQTKDALCAILVAFSAACESKFGLVFRLISSL